MGKAARAHMFEQCFHGQKSAHQHKLPIEFKAANIPRGFSNISQMEMMTPVGNSSQNPVMIP